MKRMELRAETVKRMDKVSRPNLTMKSVDDDMEEIENYRIKMNEEKRLMQ